mgnify:CR=1 FL=1
MCRQHPKRRRCPSAGAAATPALTVDANGVVRGLKAGTATITVRTTDGSNKRASVRVTVGIPATGVVITGNRIVRAGATLRLMATVQPANATVKRVTWDDFWRREAARVRKRGNTDYPRHRDGE